MKNIVKSFYNYMLVFWYQFLAFLLFIIIAVALTVGFVSNSMQVLIITDQITNKQKVWDYDIRSYFSELDDAFVYDYFQEPNNGFYNSVNEQLIDFSKPIDDNSETIGSYLDRAFESQKSRISWKPAFLGNFFIRQVLATNYSKEHKIALPRITNEPAKYADYYNVVNLKWQKVIGDYYGEVDNLINADLMDAFSKAEPNYALELSVNQMFKYNWDGNNPDKNEEYSLEPINLNKVNNVVTKLTNNQLANMKDNEVIVSDKFAKAHGWKIGDEIQLHDLVVLPNDLEKYEQSYGSPFNQKYKIIGYGMKIQNLFAQYDFFNPNRVDHTLDTGFFYLTNQEMNRYFDYLWYYNHDIYHDKKSADDTYQKDYLEYQAGYYKRLKVNSQNSVANFNNYTARLKTTSMKGNSSISLARNPIRVIFGYDSLYFVQFFNFYLIEGIVFSFIGLISLIFALLFINYSIKKQLRQMRTQLGLFKSMGYKSSELSVILWSRTYVILMVGVIIGYLISVPIQMFVNQIFNPNFYVVVQPIWSNWVFLSLVFVIIPFALSLLNFAAIIRYLHKNALSMIYMDKNFSLGSNYGKTLSWMIKTRQIKMGKWHINFSWKQFFMSLFVPLFFMFGSLLLMVQFNVNTLMDSTIDINSHVFQRDVNYGVSLGESINSTSQADNQYNWLDPNLKQLEYKEYHNRNDLQTYHNLDLDKAINDYIKEANPFNFQKELQAIMQQNLNHKSVDFFQVVTLLNKLILDYDKYKNLIDLSAYATIVEQLRTQLEKAAPFISQIRNPQLQLTINNAFVKPNVDYPILKLQLYNYRNYNKTNKWQLFLVNGNNQNIFVDLDYNLLANQNLKTQRVLPVVISERFSVLNHVNVGKKLEAYINFSNRNLVVEMLVVGINHDKVTNTFYGLEQTFLDQYVTNSLAIPLAENEHIYNTIYSKGDLFEFNSNNLMQTTLNNDYFNFYYASENDVVSLQTLLQNPRQVINYLSWGNLTTTYFHGVELERYLAKQTISDVTNLIYILLGFTLLLLLTLFEVFFILGTVDNRLQIKLLKAFGYTQTYISLHLLRKHIISITVGVVLAIVINYFVWAFLIKWLFDEFGILLYNPFNVLWTVISTLIIVGLFLSGSLVALKIIQKTSPVLKTGVA